MDKTETNVMPNDITFWANEYRSLVPQQIDKVYGY